MSARSPTPGADHKSPSMWIAKMLAAIAVARISLGTLSKMTALIGDVDRKIALSQAKKRTKKRVDVGAKMATAASGVAKRLPTAQTRRNARERFSWSPGETTRVARSA
jgi:hypothetical protein